MQNLFDDYYKKVSTFLQFKSISQDSKFTPELQKTADWLTDLFKENSFNVKQINGYGAPVVFAEFHVDDSLPTCLIYGHYDVQPADELTWKSDPFILNKESDKFIGRGIVDNKGQILIHITSIIQLIEENNLRFNIKFLIEGNEETGSQYIEKFILDNSDKLKSDYVIVSDGSLVENKPTIEVGFRGILNLELEVITSSKDIHSGMFGTSAPNAVHELIKILGKVYDENHKIQIDGFYDNVLEFDSKIISRLKTIDEDNKQFFIESGTMGILNEPGYSYYSQTGLRPTFQVTGINGGYTGEGIKTIIPGSAKAKINIRLASNQSPKEILQKTSAFIQNHTPDYVKFNIKEMESIEAVLIDTDNKLFDEADKLLENIFGHKTNMIYVGGTIPIIKHIKDLLHNNILCIPLGSSDCNMHGANENFEIEILKKSLKFSYEFFKSK